LTTPADPPPWPPALRAAMAEPPVGRRGWTVALTPQLIALFLWVAYFDQIPGEAMASGGGVGAVALGSAAGGILAYLLLYRAPALWGVRTGRPLAVVAAATFGARGATLVPGLPLAAVQVVWMALSTFYATALTLKGLELLHYLGPRAWQAVALGPLRVPGPLFLATSLCWCAAAVLAGRYLVRVIGALMNVYPILPAALLGLAALLAIQNLPGATPVARAAPPGALPPGVAGFLVTVQMVFGFAAAVGLAGGDWGAAVRDGRDVRLAGWVGLVTAPWVIATLAALCVAGAGARGGLEPGPGAVFPAPGSVSASLAVLAGPKAAGWAMLAFGLAALAPACFAGHDLGNRLHGAFPRVSRIGWSGLGGVLAWALVVVGWGVRSLDVFGVVGALLAPAAGAVAADFARCRGRWPGVRLGWNAPGLIAWVVGAAVGLTPLVARLAGRADVGSLQPAAVAAFLAAFVAYRVIVAAAGEAGVDPRPLGDQGT